MNDIRKDFLLDRFSIISEKRGKRPNELQPLRGKKPSRLKTCFFCPGNESMTPPTIAQFPEHGQWKIRVFRNKFPALLPPKGDHEVIVDTNKHGVELQDLDPYEIVEVFRMYERRRKELRKKFNYVSIFKNAGEEAGASLAHSHTQILATPILPPIVSEENKMSQSYYNKWHRCAWCDDIKEIENKHTIKKTKHTIAITANAPRFSCEAWVMPTRHVASFSDLTNEEALDFCEVLKPILKKAYSLKFAYNFAVHNAPKGADKYYHFHIEILPRVVRHAGFELGEGAFIVDTSPETAAKYYKT